MEVSEVKQRLLTDFFTYYPMGGALYDKNGALIDINKSLNEKFPFTNEADFLLNNLFRTDLLTDLQKQYLRGGSVVSGSLPVPYSIIPSMNENREILGYTLLLTGNPAVGQEAAGYDRELKELTDMSQKDGGSGSRYDPFGKQATGCREDYRLCCGDLYNAGVDQSAYR